MGILNKLRHFKILAFQSRPGPEPPPAPPPTRRVVIRTEPDDPRALAVFKDIESSRRGWRKLVGPGRNGPAPDPAPPPPLRSGHHGGLLVPSFPKQKT